MAGNGVITESPEGEALDRFLPTWQWGNRDTIRLPANADVGWKAVEEVTLAECHLMAFLMAVRGLPGRLRRAGAFGGSQSVAFAGNTPVLEAMVRDRFVVLHREPGRELVLGVIGQFWKLDGGIDAPFENAQEFVQFDRPGYAKVAVTFRVEPLDGPSRLVTETRIAMTDAATARTFGRYWALIRLGSKLTRIDLVRAVRRRLA